MPKIVDKELQKKEILQSLQLCLEEKNLSKVTMRDIALKANMPHSKIHYYFKNKQQMYLSYIEMYTDNYKVSIENWYQDFIKKHKNMRYSQESLIKFFIKDIVINNQKNKNWIFAKISILESENLEIENKIKESYKIWHNSVRKVLGEIFDKHPSKTVAESEVILTLVEGLLTYSLFEENDEERINRILNNVNLC
ncbi:MULTISPECIES: TetR/AcrR family transcriptional regulator [Staphylococcus]|uniref:TetR/AcrR family transcriptional regulator n=1 Tax=Staphylococcus TaxID=1279 RepID=UPI0021CEFE79|nr:TetR/AcrR family transcriptional regulator [Staphylococcus sp. IVB6181]UXV34270.1 TetR/AcrR family transcriptional regulator [Staphylococcus sp. IVB6181]